MARDRPVIHEIEITPEMIEAGADALASVNLDFESEEAAVARIYRAMERARDWGLSPAKGIIPGHFEPGAGGDS
jgi:hypothetical protein